MLSRLPWDKYINMYKEICFKHISLTKTKIDVSAELIIFKYEKNKGNKNYQAGLSLGGKLEKVLYSLITSLG